MRFELQYDQTVSRKLANSYFDLTWNGFLQKNRKNLYFSIPIALFGIAIIYGKSNLGYFFLFVGLCQLYLYCFNERRYKIHKKQYLATVEKLVLEYSADATNAVWEFKEDRFCYRDFKYDLKISWNSFTKFTVLDNDHLVLELNDNLIGTFFLDKQEVGATAFDTIIQFLERKIKPQ